MWSGADVLGLFSNNVVSFSRNVVLSGHLFSLNSVQNRGCSRFEPFMFSGRYTYSAGKRSGDVGISFASALTAL
jgi:hypothetical protein